MPTVISPCSPWVGSKGRRQVESDSRAWQSLEDALEVVAEWHVLRGRPELTLAAESGADAPGFVKAAWATFGEIPVSDLLVSMPILSASERVDRELIQFDTREMEILRLRVFADVPLTLDDLGARFGLTRERIRQIERRIVAQLQTSPALTAVRALASHALGNEHIVAPLATMLGESPALTQRVVRVEQPLWRVLDRIDDSFEVLDGWWCRGSVKSAAALTRSALQAAAEEVRALLVDDLPMLKGFPWSTDWVRYCGVHVHEGYALLASSGIADRAAVTLENEGSPLSGEDIASRLGSDRSARSVKNALASDERFVRVDRNSWALAAWGLATYQSIRQLIADEVSAHGGSVRLSKLVAGITARYSVSPTSVMGYASAPPFTTVEGFVEMASVSRATPRKSPYDTRRLFRLADGWALRFTINAEHARGSGSVLPSGLITALGMEYGNVKFLSCRLGDQRIGWNGPQLAMGSIKRLVDADILAVGDICFAVFGSDGSFDVRRVEVPEDAGPQRAFELAGVSLGAKAPDQGDLAYAVGLPLSSSRHQIAEKLRARGDYDLADCMLSGPWS